MQRIYVIMQQSFSFKIETAGKLTQNGDVDLWQGFNVTHPF